MKLKEYITRNGDVLLYNGQPKFEFLDSLAEGPGDLWHSSLDQDFNNAFPELVYQTAVFWWYLNDFEELDQSINWRINPYSFIVRKNVWKIFNGFPPDYDSPIMAAFDFGYRLLRHGGGVPMYIKGLFSSKNTEVEISLQDRYVFFQKNFKMEHSYYMFFRKGKRDPLEEWKAFRRAKAKKPRKNIFPVVPARELKTVEGSPNVSVVLPTMYRQDYTLQLLEDYSKQIYSVKEVIVVDATPEKERNDDLYKEKDFPFDLIIKWQTTKGSCRARNEAIEACTGDYVIFADDDTRVLPDFVENHISFLQTYKVEACNGLDIQAGHHHENLSVLKHRLNNMNESRWKAGASQNFSNANSCVRRELVDLLIGNDINFDGGYGEDSDYGYRILKRGGILLFNPFSANLHLKPPAGGYRHWSLQASILGKKRKSQAWELDHPVKFLKPVPSPTVLYGILKHYTPQQVQEYKSKYFFLYLYKGSKKTFLLRLLRFPKRYLQFNCSLFYARNLIKRGERY